MSLGQRLVLAGPFGCIGTDCQTALDKIEIEAEERLAAGAGQSENTDPAIGEHQRDGAKVLDAGFQQHPGKIRETSFLFGSDGQRTLMLPDPVGDSLVQKVFRSRANFRR